MTQEKRRVAILKGARDYRSDGYDDYDYVEHWVARSITDWYEVTEDEFKALQHFCTLYDYRLVEPLPPKETEDVLKQAVNVYQNYLKDEEKKKREHERARKLAAEKRKKKELEKKAKEIETVAKRAMELGLLPSAQPVAQK